MATPADLGRLSLSRRRLVQASALSGFSLAAGSRGPLAAMPTAAWQDAATQTLVASWADGPNGTDLAFHAALRSIDIYRACTLTPLAFAVAVLAIKGLLDRFLNSELGLALRATGANPRMARAQGIPVTLIFL